MTIEVREARPDDYPAAGEATAEAYRDLVELGDPDWQDYLARIADMAGRAERTTILVAVEDDRILGSATLELDGRIEDEDGPLDPAQAEIRMLGVHPAAQGRGVAKLLMAACEERARATGKTLMTLHTTHRMRAAQQMYGSLGYERDEDRVFPDGFVLLSYHKHLV